MKNIESTINDLVEILSHVIIQAYTFVVSFAQESLDNSFRRRLCKQECKMNS